MVEVAKERKEMILAEEDEKTILTEAELDEPSARFLFRIQERASSTVIIFWFSSCGAVTVELVFSSANRDPVKGVPPNCTTFSAASLRDDCVSVPAGTNSTEST